MATSQVNKEGWVAGVGPSNERLLLTPNILLSWLIRLTRSKICGTSDWLDHYS